MVCMGLYLLNETTCLIEEWYKDLFYALGSLKAYIIDATYLTAIFWIGLELIWRELKGVL